MNENRSKFIESQKRFNEMIQTSAFNRLQENQLRMEQALHPQYSQRGREIQDLFSRMDITSYVNQLNQLTIHPMEYLGKNQDIFQQLQNRVENLFPDLIQYYYNDEEIPDDEIETLQTDYSEFLEEVTSFKAQDLTDEQKKAMVQKLEFAIETLNSSTKIADDESDNKFDANTREPYTDNESQRERENKNKPPNHTKLNNSIKISMQRIRSNLSDPKWRTDKLMDFLASEALAFAGSLIRDALSGQICFITVAITFKYLASFFKNK